MILPDVYGNLDIDTYSSLDDEGLIEETHIADVYQVMMYDILGCSALIFEEILDRCFDGCADMDSGMRSLEM